MFNRNGQPFLKNGSRGYLTLVDLRKPILLSLLNFSGTKPNPKTILLEMPNLSVITSGINKNLNIMKLEY